MNNHIVAELSKLKTSLGDNAAYQYATIYAQWGNRAEALASRSLEDRFSVRHNPDLCAATAN